MKLKEAKKAYYELSAILSAGVRNISFAGIAIVWIFRISDSEIPSELLWPLIFFVASLAFDILQYTYASIAWREFYRRSEKKFKDEDELDAPDYINLPTEIFLIIKVLFVCLGYVFISLFLYERMYL